MSRFYRNWTICIILLINYYRNYRVLILSLVLDFLLCKDINVQMNW
jgi:hypothetical protein